MSSTRKKSSYLKRQDFLSHLTHNPNTMNMNHDHDPHNLDFEESDLWNYDHSNQKATFNNHASRLTKKMSKMMIDHGSSSSSKVHTGQTETARSLPMNVPLWGHQEIEKGGSDEDDDDLGDRMPPHEYLARTRRASLSVHQGIGRTLKGRDLSRLRNAIWAKTGFQD